MRFFYVLYVRTLLIRQYLDLLRLLADPHEKRSAHITVRGPYDRRYNFSSLSHMVSGNIVQITGPNSFMNQRQNTVYLKCQAPFLRQIWHKPDYPEFNPHVTIYDGGDREFAIALLEMLCEWKWEFCFETTEVMELTANDQYSLNLPIELDWRFVCVMLGKDATLSHLRRLDGGERLYLMRRAARRFDQVSRELLGGAYRAKTDHSLSVS